MHWCQLPQCISSSADANTTGDAPSVRQALWYKHLAGVKGVDGTQLSRLRLLSEQALYTLYQDTEMHILFVGGSAVDRLQFPGATDLNSISEDAWRV